MDDASPPQRHNPPHIRINSGSDDMLQMGNASSNEQTRPTASRQQSSRSLTQPFRPGAAPSLRAAASSNSVYSAATPAESSELLLPPRKSKARGFRDEDSPMRSPSQSGFNSRRTSWSSESAGSRDSRYGGPFVSPFDDSRAPSRAGSDDDNVNTQTVSEKYNILPSAGLLLFPEDVEKDDYLHNPDPNDKDGKLSCADLFSKRGLVNVGGLALITIGILILFIGYPILTFVQAAIHPQGDSCSSNPDCIAGDRDLLKNLRTGLIDPDTPSSAKSRTGDNGKHQVLAFSDEFNEDGRTFYDGDDPYFQAMDFWYGVTQDLEWYDPDAVSTSGGTLNLRFDAFKNHDLNYRSGMLQSWNKLCFKGGYLEASISLPGRGDTVGFWPGFWAMGNLGRPGYAATTDGMWPYSYHDTCDPGITPNQSDPDGLNLLPGMRLPACTCTGGDHPSPGNSRSAPEIDAIEASVIYLDPPLGAAIGDASQSFQIAPFDLFWQPNAEWAEIYDYQITAANSYQGGVYQQAISATTALNNDWYDGKGYQIYAFEYEPGADGYVTWYVGDQKTWKVTGNSVGPNGNIGQRVVPEEPMAIVANFGMSSSFAQINFTGLAPLMPATMRIDYIRIYQDEDGEMTCDPQGYPTTDYIANHPEPYANINLTHWSQANYDFPQNSFMHGCKAENYDGGSTKRFKKTKRSSETTRSWLP
ncbi:glycoside hydrolase family 16 protein [Dothistroma septosporum NZE10]|uniref:Glycoside hydrolase family 16 protein n=1 Tax=Dothistroma septosporum (strain NZE10 / CBS 128990) TaxID=675120 RepID=N1Q041_DOTSN|nr:glycoside hydrolase family 16 protein [Dothistroma septosporum NZE10]